MAEAGDLIAISRPTGRAYRRGKAPIALLGLLAVVVLAAFNVMDIGILALLAVAGMLLLRCIDGDEAWGSIDGSILILIFAMLIVGAGLKENGAVELVVKSRVPLIQGFPPIVLLIAVYATASILMLEEAYRGITFRDGDRDVSVPIAQAVLRLLAINAVKCQHRAQGLFAELLAATERQNMALADEWLDVTMTYKIERDRKFARCDRWIERRRIFEAEIEDLRRPGGGGISRHSRGDRDRNRADRAGVRDHCPMPAGLGGGVDVSGTNSPICRWEAARTRASARKP